MTLLRLPKKKHNKTEVTLEKAYQLWLIKAQVYNFSPKTIKNTESYMKMLYNYVCKETKIKDITSDTYERLMLCIRNHGYSQETIYNINATLRKLIRLCYRKQLLPINILNTMDNIRVFPKNNYRIISSVEFFQLLQYFKTHHFIRLGEDCYVKYSFLFCLLYYSGIRLGECLALQYDDFENTDCFKVHITKSYLNDFKIIKVTKNFKNRSIPLCADVQSLFLALKKAHYLNHGKATDRIFKLSNTSCNIMLQKACKTLGLPLYHCHEFRHTFISNLMRNFVPLPVISYVSGDMQETILKRYSHMHTHDEQLILKAFNTH